MYSTCTLDPEERVDARLLRPPGYSPERTDAVATTYLDKAGGVRMSPWWVVFRYASATPLEPDATIQERRGRRRRSGRGRSASRTSRGRRRAGARFAGWLLVLVVAGLAFGYGLATLFLFPAPPPPDDLVEVPSLRGLAHTRARERVLEAGLELGPAEAFRHPELDSGLVLGQAPLPGQLARLGQPVRLSVSLGPRLQAVPDVLDLRGDQAQGVIEATGFVATVDSVDAEQPAGTVVETDPVAGTVLRVPGVVRLVLSRGPASVPMPFLLGMPQQRALDTLETLGIGAAAVDTVSGFGLEEGLVVEQDPSADSSVVRGDTVRFSVGGP